MFELFDGYGSEVVRVYADIILKPADLVVPFIVFRTAVDMTMEIDRTESHTLPADERVVAEYIYLLVKLKFLIVSYLLEECRIVFAVMISPDKDLMALDRTYQIICIIFTDPI